MVEYNQKEGGREMGKKTSIVFTGDIGFDRYMDKKWEDDALLSPEILDFFHSAHHVVANVEGALINAEKYKNASAEVWEAYFAGDIAGAYVKDAHMDFGILCPLADRADDGKWQESKLDGVKAYLLSLL